MISTITHLWFPERAEEAARFYISLIPDSKVTHVSTLKAETPSGPPGSVKIVEFTLAGRPYIALEAGPLDPFNHAFSIYVECDTQEEVDRLWDALLEGGSAEQCGWLRDRYGLSWQIVPKILGRYARDEDPERARRVTEAMLKMVKLDAAELKRAYEAA